MKRFLIIVCCFLAMTSAVAQEVSFKISDGLYDQDLKSRIEINLSELFTAFNVASAKSAKSLDLSRVDITADAASGLGMLWHNMPFSCDEFQIVERILHLYEGAGFQVRNIPVTLTDIPGREAYKEIVVDMDHSGRITLINLSIGDNLYRKVMGDGKEVSDLRHRQVILDYVEQFRTAYNRKDIDFLEAVFSEDALIITGKVTYRRKSELGYNLRPKIEYNKMSKREYLDKLKNKVFPNTRYIKVTFSDVEVVRHPTKDDYYGVRLKQDYRSMYTGGVPYEDEGYLFLLWDFRDESHPQIHVRTWQPYWMDEKKTQPLDTDDIIDINKFQL